MLSRIARSRRGLAFAALAAVALPWLPQTAAQGLTAPRAAAQTVASHGPGGVDLRSVPWLNRVLRQVPIRRGAPMTKITVGDFSACPALPTGYDPANFSCFLTHITGGQMIIGKANQLINRDITLSYAEGVDPSGNTAMVFGEETSKPMPVLGGIFETPSMDSLTKGDPNLELGIQPVGLGIRLDPSGQTVGFLSMKLKAVNPVFGANCYIGSGTHPMVIAPTPGTTDPPPPNQPISGHVDSAYFNGTESIVLATVVDNAFAAPRAFHCGPKSSLTRLVNVIAGLPSPAGTNTAIFQVTIEIVSYTKIPS